MRTKPSKLAIRRRLPLNGITRIGNLACTSCWNYATKTQIPNDRHVKNTSRVGLGCLIDQVIPCFLDLPMKEERFTEGIWTSHAIACGWIILLRGKEKIQLQVHNKIESPSPFIHLCPVSKTFLASRKPSQAKEWDDIFLKEKKWYLLRYFLVTS